MRDEQQRRLRTLDVGVGLGVAAVVVATLLLFAGHFRRLGEGVDEGEAPFPAAAPATADLELDESTIRARQRAARSASVLVYDPRTRRLDMPAAPEALLRVVPLVRAATPPPGAEPRSFAYECRVVFWTLPDRRPHLSETVLEFALRSGEAYLGDGVVYAPGLAPGTYQCEVGIWRSDLDEAGDGPLASDFPRPAGESGVRLGRSMFPVIVVGDFDATE